MSDLIITATERAPEVRFDAAAGVMSIRGESYPEDASAVFGPIFKALQDFLAQADGRSLTVDFELVYFNSSSAKALMNMFQILENSADRTPVAVNWKYLSSDETMKEFGEDFSEDLTKVVFNLVTTD
jgi:hypothetical protein